MINDKVHILKACEPFYTFARFLFALFCRSRNKTNINAKYFICQIIYNRIRKCKNYQVGEMLMKLGNQKGFTLLEPLNLIIPVNTTYSVYN